jgi:ATP-dependent DNA ligase
MLQNHRSQAQAILFYAFDVLIHRGRRLIHVPLETRRELLGEIAGDLKTRTPLIGLSDTLNTSPADFIPLAGCGKRPICFVAAQSPRCNIL